MLESIVYWHLQRWGAWTTYGLVGADKHEIDFVAGPPDEPPHVAIQVCVDLGDPNCLARESRAFGRLAAGQASGIERLMITLRDPPTGLRVDYPIKKAWQWCLESAF